MSVCRLWLNKYMQCKVSFISFNIQELEFTLQIGAIIMAANKGCLLGK